MVEQTGRLQLDGGQSLLLPQPRNPSFSHLATLSLHFPSVDTYPQGVPREEGPGLGWLSLALASERNCAQFPVSCRVVFLEACTGAQEGSGHVLWNWVGA